MRNKITTPILLLSLFFSIYSCSNDDNSTQNATPKLIVKLEVNPNQIRLGNTGQPSTVPAGNAAQSPDFNTIAAHYFELAPNQFTELGQGEVIYHAPETNEGGETAIDFTQSIKVTPGGVFLEIPLNQIQTGSYEWVRLSLSYQNYDVTFHYQNIPYSGTLASFVGFNTYITTYDIKNEEVAVNGNKKQGYWGFETDFNITTGQAPEGATTVPNPLFNTSPIPAGSCVVTGEFASPLQITGNETEDIVLTLSLSTNNSFEWVDANNNGKWDVDNTAENVVDMGLRGLIPIVE